MFLLAKVLQEARPVHCTENRCVDCEEIEAYPVPRACVGDHTPSPCWGFVLDGDSERCVPKNCTETPRWAGVGSGWGWLMSYLTCLALAVLPGPGQDGAATLLAQHGLWCLTGLVCKELLCQ